MSVTIATRPIYPTPGDLTIAFIAPAGSAVRCWMLAGPDGSQSQVDVAKASGPVLVHEGDADRAWRFNADRPGIYIIRVDELRRDATAYKGGWTGSPARNDDETVVSQQELRIVVGRELSQKLGWGSTTGKLTIHLFDATVRRLAQAINGQDSPRLGAGSSSTIDTDEVRAAIAALANYTEAGIMASASTSLASLIQQFNTHIGGAHHSSADTSNAVPVAMQTLSSPKGLEQAVKALQDSLGRHIRDYKLGTTPSDTGFGKGGYHSALSSVGLPQAPAPSGANGLFSAIGDLLVACESHFSDSTAHTSTGPTVTVPAVHSLLLVHFRAAQAIRQVGATLTNTEHAGLPDLLTSGGFEAS